jgi:beta-galactosidase
LAAIPPHIIYGGDYNPDQWPEEVWQEDVRLMQEAGVNLVSLAIFSWSRIQPSEDKWDFEWLDRIMDLLHGGGVQVNLATATASPPPWLSHAHPEMLPVLADGVTLWPGARQHYCPSSPVYRDAARTLAEAMAQRYAKHPALAMWHVGNEYGCHVPACWCDVSAQAFREWLEKRYHSVKELNRAWGTDFWSQRYTKWEEILPPRRTPTWPNPSQQLDFMRFSSDELLGCYEIEREVLKRVTPDTPVTTNFMSFFKPLDYWKWAEREDVVSNDSYPDPSDPLSGMRAAMAGDLMRSLGRGRPWILMEQTSSRVNWRDVNVAKAPGQMRLWSYQAVARGADGVMFFQWRQSRAGAEKFHSAMVPHGPPEDSPVWRDVKRLGNELRQLDPVVGSSVEARVAVLLDWDSWWALELPSKPSMRVRQLEQLEAFYRPLFEANVTVDFARPSDDLSGYRLVIAPSLYLVSDEAAANLRGFVERGGTMVMSFFSGIVDPQDHIRLGGYPQPFRKLLGLKVLDFHPLGHDQDVALQLTEGTQAHGEIWSESIELAGADSLATFSSSELAGRPAITTHRFGTGTVFYLGTRPDDGAMARVLQTACTRAGVEPSADAPDGVEVVRRESRGKSILFLLNHRDVATSVPIIEAGTNLIDGNQIHPGLLHLEPRGVAIIREGW